MDTLLADWAPKLRGYVIKHYGWMETRGNCLIGIDDLVQIALIALVDLAARWDDILAAQGKTRDGNDGMFWAYLKQQTKNAVWTFYRREGNVPADGPAERDLTRGLEITTADEDTLHVTDAVDLRDWWLTVEDTMYGKITLRAIADFYDTLPRRDKILIALRHYDELPYKQVGALLGMRDTSAQELTRSITDRWRDHARNQYTDHHVEVKRRVARDWEEPDTLTAYIRDRHRNDLPTYIGRVSIAIHTDPAYLADILNPGRAYAPGASYGRFEPLSPYMQHQIDKMLGDRVPMTEIARVLGIGYQRVRGHASRRHAV